MLTHVQKARVVITILSVVAIFLFSYGCAVIINIPNPIFTGIFVAVISSALFLVMFGIIYAVVFYMTQAENKDKEAIKDSKDTNE